MKKNKMYALICYICY